MNDNETMILISLCDVLASATCVLQAFDEPSTDTFSVAFKIWSLEALRNSVNDYKALQLTMLQEQIVKSDADIGG